MSPPYVICREIKNGQNITFYQHNNADQKWGSLDEATTYPVNLEAAERVSQVSTDDCFVLSMKNAKAILGLANTISIYKFTDGLRSQLLSAEKFDLQQRRDIELVYDHTKLETFGRPIGMKLNGPTTVNLSIYEKGIGQVLPEPLPTAADMLATIDYAFKQISKEGVVGGSKPMQEVMQRLDAILGAYARERARTKKDTP